MQLIDKAVELRGSQVLNVNRYHTIIWQRRFMALATLLTVLSVFVFIVAVVSPNWADIDFVNNDLEKVHVQLGVWGEWRTKENNSITTDYYRAQAAFCVISLTLMASNNLLAFYTFYHHRYMFKRLVAGLHLVTAMCIVVATEVLTNSVSEWRVEVAKNSEYGDWDYSAGQRTGTPTYLAYGVAVVYVLAGGAFAAGSHKQKGSRAATAEFEIEDRPIHIGR
ncbi:hypothetical protein QR680_002114 [Steinernema hermaphroditum]|uniref:Uncharacterized protein n=1 Tax=Steinernema hermaphroditum TaxID=289476 RepID=A0AA39LHI7_9BILA|nr:hypothetical protein QR680_002114 [Steinernema hermaphroditum]